MNWDMTSQTPAPPYTELDINIVIDDYSGSTLFTSFYPELNGGGTPSTSSFFGVGGSTVIFTFMFFDDPSNSDFLDGVFSIGLLDEPFCAIEVCNPPPTLTSATAVGLVDGVSTENVAPEIAASQIPEPGTLALLGIGLAGLGFRLREL